MDTRQLFQKQCARCEGTGEVDSGAMGMSGHWINITCPDCEGKQTVLDRAAILGRIQNLHDTRDYAAPELAENLTRQIDILLDLIEPL